MRLLVIEDEKTTASYLRKGLSEHGFVVDVSHDGEEGLYFATQLAYDLLILEVQLPGRDGWSVLGDLRRAGNQAPVLFLSSVDTVSDKVRGLQLGADDYLVKPFAFSELLARVQTILRRSRTVQAEIVRVADLEIDLKRFRASRKGARLDLTPKEFQLLSLLARRSGEVVSRKTIADQLWGLQFDFDANRLDVHVRRLRSKVDDPFQNKLICTRRGLGYTLQDQ